MDLVAGVKNWSDKVLTEVSTTHAEVAYGFFAGVIRDTPVSREWHKGRLKGNWVPSRGKMAAFKVLKARDTTGMVRTRLVRNTISRMLANESNKKRSQSLNLTNSMYYAINAEKKGWKSTPPYRMVAKNLRRTQHRIMARRLA
jgi:hypothetical protein